MKAQNIILILEDGRKIVATCPEFMKVGESLVIKKVLAVKPFELPPGCTWEEIGAQNETSAQKGEE